MWKTVTYTQTGTTGTLYEDGVQVGQNTAVTVLPSAIGNGTTTNNVLGESNYAADNTLKGKVKNFRIYNRALTAAEVADDLADRRQPARPPTPTRSTSATCPRVTGNLTLPATGPFGSTHRLGLQRPRRDQHRRRGHPARRPRRTRPTVTLTATLTRGSGTATKTFEATVLPEEDDQAKADAAAAALVAGPRRRRPRPPDAAGPPACHGADGHLGLLRARRSSPPTAS